MSLDRRRAKGAGYDASWKLNGRRAAVPNNLNRGEETVAPARNRLNENGSIRGVSKNFTQTFDGRVEAGVEIDKGVCRPKRGVEIFARDNRAAALKQLSENEERLVLKTQLRAVPPKFTRLAIQFEGTETIARQSRQRGDV